MAGAAVVPGAVSLVAGGLDVRRLGYQAAQVADCPASKGVGACGGDDAEDPACGGEVLGGGAADGAAVDVGGVWRWQRRSLS